MTESEPRTNQGRLTNQPNHPRLELGRDFMADEAGRDSAPRSEPGRGGTPPIRSSGEESPLGGGERGGGRPPIPPGLSGGSGGGGEGVGRPSEPPRLPGEGDGEDDGGEGGGRPSGGGRDWWDDLIHRLNRIDNLESKKTEITKVLRDISPQDGVPISFLRLVAEHDETLDYLVNRIVAAPLDAETSNYSINLYAQHTLDQMVEVLKSNSEGDHEETEKYHRVLGVIEATHTFHGMNRAIVTGKLDGFVEASRDVTPEQLQVLKDVHGVAQVIRLFDEEYNRLVARDDYIQNLGDYDIMMGIKRDPETGKTGLITGGSIEDKLKRLVDRDKVLGLGGELAGLEPWQIKWAFQAGKLLNNISLRAAEQISIGKPNTGSDDETNASYAQEHAARLMNWNRNAKRFEISEGRGGVQLLDMARKFYQRDREKQGYGRMKITKIAGKDIVDFEDSGMWGASGIWSGWRNNEILLKNAKTHIAGFKSGTLGEIIEEKEIEWGRGRERAGASKETIAKEKKDRKSQYLGETYLDGSGNLRKEFNSYLGVLLKHGSLKGELLDKPDVTAMKQKIREAIWERAAQDNPLGIVPFLIGVEFVKDKNGNEIIPKGCEGLDLKGLTRLLKEKDGVWDKLREKLRYAHEKRLAAIRSGDDKLDLDRFIRENGEKIKELRLTPDEQRLLDQIRKSGGALAGEFSKVRLPFNPFMNDVLFEDAKYGKAGSAFFTRREGSDLPSIFKAEEEFVKIMDNPGKWSVEELAGILQEVVRGLGIPQSTETGQDKVAPLLEAVLTFIYQGSHIEKPARLKLFGREIPLPMPVGLLRWVSRSEVANNISNGTDRPNSLMQQFSGTNALALGERGMLDAINVMLKAGVTRKGFMKNGVLAASNLYRELKKKFKLGPGWLFLAFFKLFIPAFILGSVVETGKRTYEGK